VSDSSTADFQTMLRRSPVVLAPMEDVSNAVFRRICRSVGADVCVTEFVNVDALNLGSPKALRKISLSAGDRPTGIQIYGSSPAALIEAARISEAARPAFVDINCGCWIPRIAARGAGAGWLKDPAAMVAMAREVVAAIDLPVTVKTRIGLGGEQQMPIVDLARRLEDAGVQAIALHCRTARAGHAGAADWSWAARAQQVVKIPVIVNGDIRTAQDVVEALAQTGCAGVMIGRGAMEHPWVFREARAALEGRSFVAPDAAERLALCRRQVLENVEARGEPNGVQCLRGHLKGYLRNVPEGELLRARLNRCDSLQGTLELLDEAARLLDHGPSSRPTPVATAGGRRATPQ
jgi:tRNA-dihydrouridine synthase B